MSDLQLVFARPTNHSDTPCVELLGRLAFAKSPRPRNPTLHGPHSPYGTQHPTARHLWS